VKRAISAASPTTRTIDGNGYVAPFQTLQVSVDAFAASRRGAFTDGSDTDAAVAKAWAAQC